jgi:hypothetical protein
VSKRRLLKFGLPIVAVLVVAAVAFAFWTASGSGSGSADSASSTQDLTLSGGTPSAALYPGGDADVAVTISNPNAFPVHIDSLVLDTGGFGVDDNHNTCDTSTLGFTSQDNSGNGWDVPAKVGGTDGSLSVDLANAISMSGSADDACQGASFTVHLKPGS